MMGPSHRVAGVVAWLGVCAAVGADGWPLLDGLFIAALTSHGAFSPDMDQPYYWTARFIPGGHRAVTHWWVWPVLLAVVAWWWRFSLLPAGQLWWIPGAVAAAWASHIAGDAIFGRVPVWPRARGWRYRGLRLRTGGGVERWVAVPLMVLVGVWLAYGITRGMPTPHMDV